MSLLQKYFTKVMDRTSFRTQILPLIWNLPNMGITDKPSAALILIGKQRLKGTELTLHLCSKVSVKLLLCIFDVKIL